MNNSVFENNYNLLNLKQRQAVDKIEWPVMVVAWPWTWKTQIIALRTANILRKTDVNPENILITTFTEAWVIAIKKRLSDFLWSQWLKVNVSTIHGFSKNVIDTFNEKFLEYKAGTPIDDVDILEIIKNIIDNLTLSKKIIELTNDYDKYLYLRDIKSRISTLKQEWISKNEFISLINDLEKKYADELSEIKPTLKKYETTQKSQEKHISKLKELLIIFEEYNKILREKSFYDFNDMINFVLEKFQTDEELRYYYAEKFQYIMIDEFQDTNNAQNKIMDMILWVNIDSPNIMVVWDDDQSIYRFQWANIENMLDFATKYQNTEIIVLENNYRSTQWILDLCSNLIDNNNQRLSKKVSTINKKLLSSNPKFFNIKELPKIIKPQSVELERSFLLESISKYLKDWLKPEEIAVIVRNNKEVEELSKFFELNEIWVISKQNTDILKNEFVIFILKFFNCLLDINNNEHNFIDVCRNDILWLNQVDIFKINKYLFSKNYVRKQKISFFDLICDLEKIDDLELNDKDWLLNFRDKFINSSKKLSNDFFINFFNEFLSDFEILKYIETNGTFDDIQDIFTLFNKIKDFCLIDKNFSMSKFLSKIELYQKYNILIPRQIIKSQKSWINIMTAHSSKWLEFDVVFVTGLYTWNWDNKRVIDKLKLPLGIVWNWLQQDFEPIEEDRRLLFVACSRAKKDLFLLSPLSSDNKLKIISGFISEMKWYIDELQDIKISDEFLQKSIISDLKPKLYKYWNLEFDYIKDFLETYKISPTDLNIFLDDPLKFLNQVVFKYPFLDNDALIFWKVYHRVLELFYSRYKENKKMDNVWYLEFTFKALLDREIVSPESYEKLHERWINWLRWLYDIIKNSNRQVLATEYNFRAKNLFFDNIPITWKIDKIDILDFWINNNESSWQLAFFKENVVLVDYKTWSPKSIWEIKWISRDWTKKDSWWNYFRQLMFYKLLCDLDQEFSSKYDIWWLALDFVEGKDWDYKYIEVPYTQEEYEEFKNELLQSWNKISNIDYWKEILS